MNSRISSSAALIERLTAAIFGWFDAAMRNFEKAWSHVEVYLRDPQDGTAAPPGTVTVAYRTDRPVAYDDIVEHLQMIGKG